MGRVVEVESACLSISQLLIGQSVGRSVSQSVDRSVCRSVSWLWTVVLV